MTRFLFIIDYFYLQHKGLLSFLLPLNLTPLIHPPYFPSSFLLLSLLALLLLLLPISCVTAGSIPRSSRPSIAPRTPTQCSISAPISLCKTTARASFQLPSYVCTRKIPSVIRTNQFNSNLIINIEKQLK